MQRAETLSAAMVLRLVKLLEARGLPVDQSLVEAGLSRATLETPSARVSYASADRLMEAAARLVERAELGLELALTRIDESYGAAGLLLITGSTFRQGLTRSLAYQRLWGDGERFALETTTPGDCAVRFRHPGPSPLAAAVTAECALVEVLEGVRALVEPEATPLAVELAHAPLGDTTALSDHFGVTPRFEQRENRIVLAAELVDRPLRAVRDLLGSALPVRDSVSARVRTLLGSEDGLRRSVSDVAAALRLSPRTLQRRLFLEGARFNELLDDARRVLARELERAGTPRKEIAYRLGFQDPSALARARRRWRTAGSGSE